MKTTLLIELIPSTTDAAIVNYKDVWLSFKNIIDWYPREGATGYHISLVHPVTHNVVRTSHGTLDNIPDFIIHRILESRGTLKFITVEVNTSNNNIITEIPVSQAMYTLDEVLDLLTCADFKENLTIQETKEVFPKSFATRREYFANWLNKVT